MEALALPLILLSLPLWLGLVPRNYIYGFRVASTLKSDAIWYPVNTSAGRHGIALGLLMLALDLTLPAAVHRVTLHLVGWTGLILIITINWRAARRLDREGQA
jgi:hypothetical protein